MKTHWIRFLSILLALVMAAGSLPATVFAQETAEQTHTITASAQNWEEDEDLFAGYVQKQMYGGFSFFSTSYGESVLKDLSLTIYRLLKSMAANIAANGGSAVLKVSKADLGTVSTTFAAGEKPGDAIKAELGKVFDLNLLLECLLMDCPYELYWFDKLQGISISYGYSYSNSRRTVTLTNLQVFLAVSQAYQAPGYSENAPAVITDVARVSAAVDNAKAVVAANQDKSDMDKLSAYRDYICDAVSYNYDALGGNLSYGDPWQLIYVFDGDDSTKVVCEGYSKAFQYLCELSDFEADVTCYSVSGVTVSNSGSGGHMWNLVHYEDGVYLVDLTNTDEGMIGSDGELFMTATPAWGDGNGYTFSFFGTDLSYIYDAEILSIFTPAELTLKERVTLKPEKFTIPGVSMSLGNSLGLYFWIPAANVAEGDYAVITKEYVTVDPYTVTVPMTKWAKSGEYYLVAFDGIAAKEMTDSVTCTVYNANGEQTSNPKVTSIRTYADIQLGAATTPDALKTVLVDMLNYGAAAQGQFSYGTDNLANAGLSAENAALATAAIDMNTLGAVKNKGTGWAAGTLSLQSNIVMNVIFDNTVVTNEMTAKVSYTDYKGDVKSYEIAGSSFRDYGDGKHIMVDIDTLVVSDLATVVSIDIYNGETLVSENEYNMAQYCQDMASVEAVVALAKYCTSARSYFV